MGKSLASLVNVFPSFFNNISEIQEKQDILDTFQSLDMLDMLVIVSFIAAYGIALSIAISGIFRKYFLNNIFSLEYLNF